MRHAIGLWSFCFGLWLLLSGHFTDPLLLSFGVLSCALAVFIAWRIEMADPEEQPLRLKLNVHILGYWPWLAWQIVLANLDVTRRILDPKLPISPTMIKFRPTQHTDLGRVIHANSITLTPGTVTTSLSGDTLEVHALTREAAEAVLAGAMDRRVTQLEVSP